MDISRAARLARERKRLSTQELAKRSGVSQRILNKLESGNGGVRLSTALSLADVLGLSLDEYFGLTPVHRTWEQHTGDMGAHAEAVREKFGFSRCRLAEESGVAHSTIKTFETGQRDPSILALLQITDAIGISLSEYIGQRSPK